VSLESSVEQKKNASALPITALVASPRLFPHLKFQHKRAYFRGKWHGRCAGRHLSESWRDTFCSDPKISLFVRLRTLVASGIFWLLFFAVEKE
jgi:hypothetical protein